MKGRLIVMKMVIVTGMSGAGKSTALNVLEDEGYYCVDNMPISLVVKFAELAAGQEEGYSDIALGIDIRSGNALGEFDEVLDELSRGIKSCIWTQAMRCLSNAIKKRAERIRLQKMTVLIKALQESAKSWSF